MKSTKQLLFAYVFSKMNEYLLNFINYDRNVLNHVKRQNKYYLLRQMNEYFLYKKGIDYKIQDIELKDIIEFISQLRTTPISKCGHKNGKYLCDGTIFNKLVSIRMFFKYLNIIGVETKINREQIPIFHYPEKKREPMSDSEYKILRQATLLYADSTIEGLRDELLIMIPRETGLRRAEIVRVRFEDFHKNTRQFQVLVKGGRYESVFFSESLREKILHFEEKLKQEFPFTYREYVISHLTLRDRGLPFHPNKASTTVHKYVKILQEKGMIRNNITLHQARHSFAMRCVYSGLSQQATTQLMHHRNPRSTMQYYHLNDTRLQEQYDLIQ